MTYSFAHSTPVHRTKLRIMDIALLSPVVGLIATGVYLDLGRAKVNASLADISIILSAFILLTVVAVRHKLIRVDRRVARFIGLWWAWLGFIGLSLLQPLSNNYIEPTLTVIAFVKPVSASLYMVLLPIWMMNRPVDGRLLVWLVRFWSLFAALQVVIGFLPNLREIMWFGGYRFRGFFQDPNLYAVYASQSALLSLGLAALGGWRARALSIASFALCTLGIYLSSSRTGLAAYVAGLMVIALLSRPTRRWLLAMGVFIVMAGGILIGPTQLSLSLGRLGTASYATGLVQRTETWGEAVDAIRQHPFSGVGREHLGAWKLANGMQSRLVAHNTYLGSWAETGLGGTLIFWALFVFVPVKLFVDMWKIGAREDPLAAAFISAYVSILIGGIGINIENYRGGWLVLGFCLAWLRLRSTGQRHQAGEIKATPA